MPSCASSDINTGVLHRTNTILSDIAIGIFFSSPLYTFDGKRALPVDTYKCCFASSKEYSTCTSQKDDLCFCWIFVPDIDRSFCSIEIWCNWFSSLFIIVLLVNAQRPEAIIR